METPYDTNDEEYLAYCDKCDGLIHLADKEYLAWEGTIIHKECEVIIPHIPHQEIIRITREPWLWLEEQLALGVQQHGKHKYLITFTTTPDVNLEEWLIAVRKELKRKYIVRYTAVLEHLDTNAHCHVFMRTSSYVKKQTFENYNEVYGTVDIKKVKKDNGIASYFDKENNPVTDADDLKLI